MTMLVWSMAASTGAPNIEDSCQALSQKILSRHAGVFIIATGRSSCLGGRRAREISLCCYQHDRSHVRRSHCLWHCRCMRPEVQVMTRFGRKTHRPGMWKSIRCSPEPRSWVRVSRFPNSLYRVLLMFRAEFALPVAPAVPSTARRLQDFGLRKASGPSMRMHSGRASLRSAQIRM